MGKTISTSKVTTNQLLFQNCNYTWKTISISVVVASLNINKRKKLCCKKSLT